MANFIIYNPSGVQIAYAKKLEYNGEWMGERNVTLTISSATVVPFVIGCYVEYRGERFVLNNIPTSKKQGAPGAYGESFVYENIKFNSLSDELVRCHFDDTVINDNTTHYTYLPSFSFYAANVKVLATRLQANLNRLYTGTSAWNILVDVGVYNSNRVYYSCKNNNYCDYNGNVISATITESVGGKTNVNISISNNNCWDALAKAYSEFDVNFFISKSARKIVVGGPNREMSSYGSLVSSFKFGKGYGLRSITRTIDDNQAVVTRLRAFGNTTNMPPHYYNKYTTITGVMISWVMAGNEETAEMGCTFLSLNIDTGTVFPSWLDRQSSDSSSTDYKKSTVVLMIINNFMFAGQYCIDGWGGDSFDTERACWKITAIDTTNLVVNAVVNKFSSGLRAYQLPAQFIDSTLSGNIAVQNLMMCPFPSDDVEGFLTDNPTYRETGITGSTTATDPFVDSDVKATLGIREATVVFDGSGDDVEDIYPSIEGMKNSDIFPGGNNQPLDKIIGASTITDDGIFADGATVPNFTVNVRKLGFNLKDVTTSTSSNDLGTIAFKDGMLGGREFKIVKETAYGSSGKTWECERVKDEATGYYYPNSTYAPQVNDEFVILNIFMPDNYITAASRRLLVAAQRYLLGNNSTHFKYEPVIDDIYMARQHDSAASGTSYHDTIMEGDNMTIEDTDLFGASTISMPIASLSIKEQEGRIPQYTISLDDKKASSFIERVMSAVNTKTASVGSATNGITTAEAIKAGEQRFISKLSDDAAQGHITFNKGITTKDAEGIDSITAEAITADDITSGSVDTDTLETGTADVSGLSLLHGETKSDSSAKNYQAIDLTTSGWGVNADGQAVFKSLVLRDYLMVPELRYNRITVQAGVTWLAPGAGKVKRCWFNSGNCTSGETENNSRVIELDLEEGDYGSFVGGDLCIGMYHTGTAKDSAATIDTVTTTGQVAKLAIKGFMTVYFTVAKLYDEGDTIYNEDGTIFTATGNAKYLKITKRTLSGTDGYFPVANMAIVAIGNSSVTSRQSSVYATTNYFRFLKGVRNWTLRNYVAFELDNNGMLTAHNAGSIKITSDNASNGYWDITGGAIAHKNSSGVEDGLKLTANGEILDPTGLHIKLNNKTVDDKVGEVTQGLSDTGIDISEHKILITSDKFDIQNNYGEKTFKVGQYGEVTLMGALNNVSKRIHNDDVNPNYETYIFMHESRININFLYLPQSIIIDENMDTSTITWSGAQINLPDSYYSSGAFHHTPVYVKENGTVRMLQLSELRCMIGKKWIITNKMGYNISFAYLGTDTAHGYSMRSFNVLPDHVVIMECKIAEYGSAATDPETIYWEFTNCGLRNTETDWQ